MQVASFLTGSQRYGSPRPDSDTDLCILVSQDDLIALERLCPYVDDSGSADGIADASLRFGKLNLIVFTDEARFLAWKAGTELLETRKPVSRNVAIAVLDVCEKSVDVAASLIDGIIERFRAKWPPTSAESVDD